MKRRHILKSVSGLAASGITLGKVGGDILEVNTNTVGNVDEEVLEVILESQTLEQLRSDFSYTVLETDAAEYKSVEIERETGETSGWRVLRIPSNIGNVQVLLSNGNILSL